MIAVRSCLISSIHVRCGLPLGRLTFLRYSASASLAGVSGCSLMRWPSQLMRRLCIVVLHSSVLVLVYSSMLVIFLGQSPQSGLDIGYVPAGPRAIFRLSGQFGPQQFIFCWPAGPVTFISVVNTFTTFSFDLSRARGFLKRNLPSHS